MVSAKTSSEHPEPAIVVTALSKVYGTRMAKLRVHAIDNLSFTVAKGASLALVGPNGSGKSSVLNILSTLVRPTSGEILILGVPISKKTEVLKLLAYMPEHPNFRSELTIREIAITYSRFRGDGILLDQLEDVAAMLGLKKWLDVSVGQLSAGMEKRVSLMLVALSDASILLLDEPSSNLDDQGIALLRSLLLEWQKQAKSILIATHREDLFEGMPTLKMSYPSRLLP